MVEVQQSISMPLSPMTSIHSHLSHPKYRADIDGLRAIAVLSVVAFHAFPNWLKGGFAGVDVFFVISGFLISTVIFENLDRGTFNFAEFYARRIKRIFPALLLVLIASFTFGWFALLPDEYKQLGKHMAAGAGFVSNLVLWSEAGYFDSSAEIKPLLHLWSLGIEEQFYIFWPLLLWLAWRQKFNLLTITIFVTIVSFVVNINEVKQDTVATFYSPFTRFWELLSGSLLAWATIYKTVAFTGVKTKLDGWMGTAIFKQAPEPDGKTLSNVVSFVGLFLLVYGFLRINKELSFPGKWALVPVLGAVLLIAAGPKAWVNHKILSNKIIVWFGLISFPLYLWHWPLLSFARIIESEVPSRNIRIAAVVLSIALAWLTYKLVERRVRLGGHNKFKVVTLVVLMTIVCYIGYNTYNRDGLKFRYAAKVGLANDFAWPSSFRNICKKITESKDSGGWCNDGNIEDEPKVLLLGDSFATSYSQLFYFYSKNNNLTYKQYGVGQCPPLLDFGPTVCSDAAKFYLESLRNSPATEYVVLAAAWYSYVNGKNYDWLHKSTTTSEFLQSFTKTLDFLVKNTNKKIIVFLNAPVGGNPKSCVVRPFSITNKQNTCDIPLATAIANNGNAKSIITNVLKSYPMVSIYDPADFLCNNDSCKIINGTQILYIDSGHMSKLGGEYLANESKLKLDSIFFPNH